MFGKAKSKKLAKIISIKNPTSARKSSKKLLSMFKKSGRKMKVKIKRASVLAGNRAGAFLKRKRLSTRERKQFRIIKKIYKNTSQKMKIK